MSTAHTLGDTGSLHLGRVTDNDDPERRGRVKVALQALEVELWASVANASAGEGYGTSFLPRREEVVVVAFISPELPIVLGSLWSGQSSAPGEPDPVEDHYVVRTPAGTVMEYDDGDGPAVEIRTPQGYRLRVTDGAGGEAVLERGGQSVTLTADAVAVRSSSQVTVDASTVTVNAASVTVNAGISRFSGVVQADTVITNAVVSSSYSPGAGNIW